MTVKISEKRPALNARLRLLALCLGPALLGACDEGEDADGDAETTLTAEASGPGDACTAEIRIGLFKSDSCDGEPVLTVTLPIEQSCATWNHGDRPNSASRFQCYRDRLCYTQYVSTATCDADSAVISEDKESRTTCTKDPTPSIYTKILGGTEGCPEPPEGFECPITTGGMGTAELAAACEGD